MSHARLDYTRDGRLYGVFDAGECKNFMKSYLDCLRKNGSNSTPCRHLNKEYLECRMSRCVPPLFSRKRRSLFDLFVQVV